jgi:hypothetical protein
MADDHAQRSLQSAGEVHCLLFRASRGPVRWGDMDGHARDEHIGRQVILRSMTLMLVARHEQGRGLRLTSVGLSSHTLSSPRDEALPAM